MTQASRAVQIEKNGGIYSIILNRPSVKNALTSEMVGRLIELLGGLGQDAACRVVLLRAIGADFSSGGDMGEISAILNAERADRAEIFRRGAADIAGPLLQAFRSIPQPVLASVRGYAIGVGLQLVLLSDLTVASSTARFLAPQVRLGHTLDHGESVILPVKVGLPRALQLSLLGEVWNAADAERYGLVNWVVPDDELDAKAVEISEKLAAAPPLALKGIKSLLLEAAARTPDQQLAAEAGIVAACASSDDFEEALKASLEKRRPAYVGK